MRRRESAHGELPDVQISTVLPGVVATGGPDSRALPSSQPVEEVAAMIADLIEQPRAELYTRPQMRELAGRDLGAEDVAALDAQPPFSGFAAATRK